MFWCFGCALLGDRIRIGFSVSLTIEPEDDETVLFGKAVSTLQSDMESRNNAISGNLKYVTGYTDYSTVVEEQVGNFLALSIGSSLVAGVTTAELLTDGVSEKLVTIGESKNVVFRITDPKTQVIIVKTTKDGEALTKRITLEGLTLVKVPIAMTVKKETASLVVLGKLVSDLQVSVVFSDLAISGTLKYVEGYEGYSDDVTEQEGNYIALNVTTNREGAVITGTVMVGELGGDEVEADVDGSIVLRITDAATETIMITAIDGLDTKSVEYTLSALVLSAKA